MMIDKDGWLQRPDEVKMTMETFPNPVFNFGAPQKVNTFLHQIFKKVVGRDRDEGPQLIGDCVSWGWMGVVDYEQAMDLHFNTNPTADLIFEQTATEVIYAGSRCEIGNQWGWRSDGSVGAWAAKFLEKYGAMSRPHLQRLGLNPDYDPNRAKEWGRTGVPDKLEPNLRKMKECSQVRTFDEFCALNQRGKTVAVCSNIGFENSRSRSFITERDKDGFATPRGTWNHCMQLVSSINTGPRPGGLCINQWPKETIRGEQPYETPNWGFWIDAEVIDRMLAQGDSFTADIYEGYPARPLTWES